MPNNITPRITNQDWDLQAMADQFWRHGFLVIPDLFDSELMDSYDQLITEHFGHNPDFEHESEFLEKAATEVIPWFPQREGVAEFDLVQNDRALNELTTEILGQGWYSDYCMVMFSKKGTKGQAWHQDCSPDKRSQFNLNRLIYTADIKDRIGGQVAVVPGSHLRGELPAGDGADDFPERVILKPTKGTVVLLHGHTWHKVYPIKEGYRSSTNYRSAPIGTPEGITDICVYQNMRYQFSSKTIIESRI